MLQEGYPQSLAAKDQSYEKFGISSILVAHFKAQILRRQSLISLELEASLGSLVLQS
jgi:hypothetical protein